MVYERNPDELTGLGKRLLEVLQEAGDWQTRTEIAARLGRSKLVPYDVSTLNDLARRGLVEAVKRDKPAFIPFEWVYRIRTPLTEDDYKKVAEINALLARVEW